MNFKSMAGGGVTSTDGKQQQQQLSAAAAGTAAAALTRQPSSVYSLTFDEFQSTLGKDFGSMNMDELLRSIWSAEESQALASAAAAPTDPSGTNLQRQGSLTLPRTLSQKTVDEVWRDLISGGGSISGAAAAATGAGVGAAAAATGAAAGIQQPQRQQTLGEMTLEEFLFRAGVVREEIAQPRPAGTSVAAPANAGFWGEIPSANSTGNIALGFGQMAQGNRNIVPATIPVNPAGNMGLPIANSPVIRNTVMAGVGDPTVNTGLVPGVVGLGAGGVTVAAAMGSSPANQLGSDVLGKSNGDLSSVSPLPYPFNGGIRGKRSGAALEKVVERRQRRMIKNRESAARSRARKQAYTMELEAEVAKLKQQNQELQKKQTELMEMQKNQVLEMMNQQYGPKRQCLRRTLTGPW